MHVVSRRSSRLSSRLSSRRISRLSSRPSSQPQPESYMIDRRRFLGITAGAGATLALPPALLRALQGFPQQRGKLMQRAIPSSGEMLPVISFAPRPTVRVSGPGEVKPAPTDVPAAKEVLKTFLDNGGKVVDVLHGGPV